MTGSLGRFGESWALAYLQKHGYVILDRNVRYRVGEIDIVAEEGGDLVFVEVKCRRSSRYGTPESSITPARYARLAAAAETYLATLRRDTPSVRVDVVAIEVGREGRVTRCALLRGCEPPV